MIRVCADIVCVMIYVVLALYWCCYSCVCCSRRERHAKTLDIAQEEVLTCLGSYLYVRFNRLLQKIKLEEQTWQQLSYIGICCLRQNFEVQTHGVLVMIRSFTIMIRFHIISTIDDFFSLAQLHLFLHCPNLFQWIRYIIAGEKESVV